DRAGAEQIEIGEVEPLVDLEILIAQIAPADNRQAAVGHYQLVVHASMLAGQVQQAAEGACDEIATAQVQRIEDMNGDVRVRGEDRDLVVVTVAGGVVEQNPHAHAAIGRMQKLADQSAGAEAVVDDV